MAQILLLDTMKALTFYGMSSSDELSRNIFLELAGYR
jgi:hypothetical protein